MLEKKMSLDISKLKRPLHEYASVYRRVLAPWHRPDHEYYAKLCVMNDTENARLLRDAAVMEDVKFYTKEDLPELLKDEDELRNMIRLARALVGKT